MAHKNETPRTKLIRQLKTLLGNNLIETELEIDDYNTVIDITLDRYKQRASNSTEECMVFLKFLPDKSVYDLPDNVIDVKQIYRRGLSSSINIDDNRLFDPFDIAFTNFYLLQASGQFGLASWELYNSFIETTGRLFGADMNFRYDTRTKKLTIDRNQRSNETVALHAYLDVDDDLLIKDRYAGPWIRSYALAEAKILLGQAYEKFSNLPTPGGVTLNGSQLKVEGEQEKERLEEELRQYVDGSLPLGFIVG